MNEDLDYFEDIEIGRRYVAPRPFRVTRDDIVEYASIWDWRPHHVDEHAASASVFQRRWNHRDATRIVQSER